MKNLLLIMEDLSTGKSTFANILSRRYDTNVFFKDAIKEVLAKIDEFMEASYEI